MASPEKTTFTRRNFVKNTALAGGALTAAQLSASSGLASLNPASAAEENAAEEIALEEGHIILFQGDSITDAGRDKSNHAPNELEGLGGGYPRLITTELLEAHPSLNLQCYNRGISGNKIPQLAARWEEDCIALAPDVLSILIGVNDMWHGLNGRYDGTVETYETGFAELLASTKASLPDVTLVICEPFVLRCGSVNDRWFPEFDERRAAAKRVSDDADAIWIPFQQMFNDALSEDDRPRHWIRDGVHPTHAGHALMAKTWLEITGLG